MPLPYDEDESLEIVAEKVRLIKRELHSLETRVRNLWLAFFFHSHNANTGAVVRNRAEEDRMRREFGPDGGTLEVSGAADAASSAAGSAGN